MPMIFRSSFLILLLCVVSIASFSSERETQKVLKQFEKGNWEKAIKKGKKIGTYGKPDIAALICRSYFSWSQEIDYPRTKLNSAMIYYKKVMKKDPDNVWINDPVFEEAFQNALEVEIAVAMEKDYERRAEKYYEFIVQNLDTGFDVVNMEMETERVPVKEVELPKDHQFPVSLDEVDMSIEETSLFGLTDSEIWIAEKVLHEKINAYRATKGLEPYVWNDTASFRAREFSKYQIETGTFDHYADGKSPSERMGEVFEGHASANENLYSCWGSGYGEYSSIDDMMQQTLEAWINSPGHNDNLLSGAPQAGIGVYFTNTSSGCFTGYEMIACFNGLYR